MGRSFSSSSACGDSSCAFSDCNSGRAGEFSSPSAAVLLSTPTSSFPTSSLTSPPPTSTSNAAPPWSSASSPSTIPTTASRSPPPAPLNLSSPSSDPLLQEHATTAILNLSLFNDNKILIADSGAIKPLISNLRTGTSGTRENAACALLRLSQIDDHKLLIGRSGAVPHLINLLETGGPRGKKDASTALFELCSCRENKIRAIECGIVRPLLDLMADPESGVVDKAACVLKKVVEVAEGRNVAVKEGGVPVLVEMVEVGSQRQKEIAMATLLLICEESIMFRKMVAEEGAIPSLVAMSQTCTSRAKMKVEMLIQLLRPPKSVINGGTTVAEAE